jgi:integrase
MATSFNPEPLSVAMEEYKAVFSPDWKHRTLAKYDAEFRDFLAWLLLERRPATTASLDFATLLAYVGFLKAKPAVRGIWRGDPIAVARAAATSTTPRSFNTVGASMRSIRAFVLWLFEDGRIAANPFARKNRRGGQNPLIPRSDTPTKSATLGDIEALERGCAGRTPLDLRDQAIVSILKTTGARNMSVRLLRLDDVDMDRNVVTFVMAKSDRTYEVALHPESKAAIVRYLSRGRPRLLPHYPVRGLESVGRGDEDAARHLFLARDNGASDVVGPLTTNGLSEMLTRRYHAGGGTILHFGSHRIRHGTATLLANNGMGLEELARHLGHSSTKVTQRYAPQTAEAIGRYAYSAMRDSGLTKAPRRR